MSADSTELKRVAPIRAVVADDEPTAREYLKLMLDRIGGVEVVGEAGEAAECLKQVADCRPEVVFLDIHLPDDSGMDVAKALAHLRQQPQIVFVTGYDEYAVPAFEVAAADYVMKPYNQERLEKAVVQVRDRLNRPHSDASSSLPPLGKIAIRDREGVKLVPIERICYISTSGRKTVIHTGSQALTTHYTLSELEVKLRDHRFFRANEGCLVNLSKVREVVYDGPRTYELLLAEPEGTFIPLSRSRTKQLRDLLDF